MRKSGGKLRAGVIGIGIGSNHMRGYASHPKCELLAICDLNVEQAKKAAEKYGATYVFRDYRQLIAMDELDIVSVATPNYLHSRMTVDTLPRASTCSARNRWRRGSPTRKRWWPKRRRRASG